MANRLAWWALGGLVSVGCAASMFALIQWAEHQFMPVVEDFKITSQAKAGQGLQISGEMNKVRDYCKFLEVSAYSGKSYLKVEFIDTPPIMLGRSRSSGVQNWGPWLITPYHDEIKLVSRHKCHFMWETTTVLFDQK